MTAFLLIIKLMSYWYTYTHTYKAYIYITYSSIWEELKDIAEL